MKQSSFNQLCQFLKEMFQFDENDLDFGVFRILNLKRSEIERFIDGDGEDDLQGTVQRTLEEIRVNLNAAELAEAAAFVDEKGIAGQLHKQNRRFSMFLDRPRLDTRLREILRNKNLRVFVDDPLNGRRLATPDDMLAMPQSVIYSEPIPDDMEIEVLQRLNELCLDQITKKLQDKVQYDINRRLYRLNEPLQQNTPDSRGDFIYRYTVTREFSTREKNEHFKDNARYEIYLMRNVESLRSIGVYLTDETRLYFPDFVLWIIDNDLDLTRIVLLDPKGQTGLSDLGVGEFNRKVLIANKDENRQATDWPENEPTYLNHIFSASAAG